MDNYTNRQRKENRLIIMNSFVEKGEIIYDNSYQGFNNPHVVKLLQEQINYITSYYSENKIQEIVPIKRNQFSKVQEFLLLEYLDNWRFSRADQFYLIKCKYVDFYGFYKIYIS